MTKFESIQSGFGWLRSRWGHKCQASKALKSGHSNFTKVSLRISIKFLMQWHNLICFFGHPSNFFRHTSCVHWPALCGSLKSILFRLSSSLFNLKIGHFHTTLGHLRIIIRGRPKRRLSQIRRSVSKTLPRLLPSSSLFWRFVIRWWRDWTNKPELMRRPVVCSIVVDLLLVKKVFWLEILWPLPVGVNTSISTRQAYLAQSTGIPPVEYLWHPVGSPVSWFIDCYRHVCNSISLNPPIFRNLVTQFCALPCLCSDILFQPSVLSVARIWDR